MGLSVEELYELGYEMYIEPTTMIRVAANAIWEAARNAKAAGHSNVLVEQHGNLYDHLEKWMDVSTVRRFRTWYFEQENSRAASEVGYGSR
jgi:2-methylisocitrate lyase-like PEP mutase family enzyme